MVTAEAYRVGRHILAFSLLVYSCAMGGIERADLNSDGVVDSLDLHELSGVWLDDCYEQPCYNLDVDGDGFIDFADIALVGDKWRHVDAGSRQLAYWPFDESGGLITYDVTGNGHDAELRNMGSSSFAPGKWGNALYFDGVNDYLSVYELDRGLGQYFVKDFSIAVWVKLESISERYQTVIGVESTNRFTSYGFEGFTVELDNGLPQTYIAYADDQREIVPAATPLAIGQWQHLCIVRSGPVVRIYLDGKLDNARTINDVPIKFDSDWAGYDVMGATNDSYYGVTTMLEGGLDEVHLYNFAIPESMIRKLARQDFAHLPQPRDAATNTSAETVLTWCKGTWTQDEDCHDVYLGTDYVEVFSADTGTTQIYRGRQSRCLYDPCGLSADTTYYWRVDDVNGASIHTGEIWAFSTSNMISSIEASSSLAGYEAGGALDGDRFAADAGTCWRGAPGQANWYWQVNFSEPRQVGAVLMIMGSDGLMQANSPTQYVWQHSDDGIIWNDISETAETNERRLFRIHRFDAPVTTGHLRLEIVSVIGSYPTVREIELYSDTAAEVPFNDWLVAVSIIEDPTLPGTHRGYTQGFIDLARSCVGWGHVQVQQVWLGNFDESYLDIEPYPLCGFLSGSILDWCQRTRGPFAGLQEVVDNGNLPIWGSCGGAQLLGILLDTGYELPWDCPRCRIDHHPPYSPIYGHIGYIDPDDPGPCGDYEHAIMEVGPTNILKVGSDPVFSGLPSAFLANESHMGQLEYLPAGWQLIARGGTGAKTYHQCYRDSARPIYGAQFHIENWDSATWGNSIKIMTNFLNVAQQWGGYQPQ
jgi:hypothetical protein